MPPRRRSRLLTAVAIPLLLAAVTMAAVPGVIRVRRGDTLSELALKYGTTVEALQELNHLRGTLIYTGQSLRVRAAAKPKTRATKPRPAARPTTRIVELRHLVRSGDSLIRIARKYGVAPDVVAKRNKLPRSKIVRLGEQLVIPVRRRVPAAASRGRTVGRVSKAYVRTLIIRESRAAGVDANLALALAWQESGLQQHVVSSVGAVGVMQVMPGTGWWISQHLVHRPLNLNRVEDNVLAGVRYLALLIRLTGSRDQALAGYYQGLASVRRRGMYIDTKRYVKNINALLRRLAR